MHKAAFPDFTVELIKRITGEPEFKVLSRPSALGGTFGWRVRQIRLWRDYERRVGVSTSMIDVATGSLPLRRIHP